MGTRAAAFTAKIHNLQHFNTRLQAGVLPLPSGDDVANTLKYFSQTLLSVLKDVPSISLEMLRCAEKDYARVSLFPSLDYKGLFSAIVELVDTVPLVQHGAHVLGQTILHTLACLVPFLEHEYIDTLPYLMASSMTLFPCSLHKDIIDMLCKRLLPFTFSVDADTETQSYANMSTAAVLMMIFQYTDCNAFHSQVLECFMSLKKDVVKDLLCVIAYGTAKARGHAVELLFQYLPSLNPALLDRKGIGQREGWKPLPCQRESCKSTGSNEATKMCFNHSIAIGSAEQPPPLYICEACAEDIINEHGPQHMTDVLLPMDKVSATCENPDCKATDKSAIATCFSIECANLNSHRPIRYCTQCVVQYHNNDVGFDHIIHTTIPSPWDMDLETQSYMVEAVVNLLREAEPLNEKHQQDNIPEDGEESTEVNVVEERQLLSRYGIWLLVGLCTPNDNTPVESLGRVLSMLFQWFHYTACLPDDQAGNALERLKAEYIHGWLMEIVKSHFDVFVSCLLPHPADYAKVGGHWETWPSYTNQIKEGFKRLLCLVPYDIVTLEVWEYIMPYWMESFRHEIMETEFPEMKILLSKVLDPDLSPLGFDTKQMYKFLSIRFENCSLQIQEQTLSWLQILTLLEVPVPFELLYEMFTKGIETAKNINEGKPVSSSCKVIPTAMEMHRFMFADESTARLYGNLKDPYQTGSTKVDAELTVPCFILMLDILIKQLELQEISLHKGLTHDDAQSILLLQRDMLKVQWQGVHTCENQHESCQCDFCEICAIWFQLCLMLIEYFSPVMEVTMADIICTPKRQVNIEESESKLVEVEEETKELKTQSDISETVAKDSSLIQSAEVKKATEETLETAVVFESTSVLAATIQELNPDLDTVSIIPTENIVPAVANAVTITDDDVAKATCHIQSPTIVNDVEHVHVEDFSFWETSEGKFKFTIEELPPQLQVFYVIMKNLPDYEDAEVLYHVLACLKVMCLHAEILNRAAHTHRGFVIWCQENLLITNFWKLLQGEFSHIAQLATCLLLHCITLPCGSDMFWKTVEHDFHSDVWTLRYAAVEKVTMVTHFAESATVKNSPLLQSALANAFCYLVHCADDIQPTVSQKALLNLETIKTTSLKLFLWCLEIQFDSNVVDRPMILQTVSQLFNHLSSKQFLSWDFFFTRFDTLFLEAQVILEKHGEVSYVRDLKNTNTNSELFQKKLKRAHDALSLRSSMRSLTASFGPKWTYKRAMSAPGGMIARQDKTDKDKFYERQSSAPVLKRKSSRLIGSTVSSLAPVQHFPNSFFTDSNLKETMQEESHFLNVLHRAMDFDDHDSETLHLLIFLLMQFLSSPDPAHKSEEKVSRSQHIVLRHLNILLGYSQTQNEGKFLLPPHKIRNSTVFYAFIMSLPKVLDYNFVMGNFLLGTCLSILVCSPAPQKYPTEHYPPPYTLWLLEAYCRHSWLLSTLVILYKYHYDCHPYSKQIQWLITIVLNTLKAQWHKCKLSHEPLLSPLPLRSREFSSQSGELEHEREKDISYETGLLQEEVIKPFIGSGIKTKIGSRFSSDKEDMILEQYQKSKDRKSWKASERSCSSDGEDMEPELEAIPESPKSENSIHEEFVLEFTNTQSPERACVRMVQESYHSEDHIVVTGPWEGLPDGVTIMSGSAVDDNIQEPAEFNKIDQPHINIIEKSVVENMEKFDLVNSSVSNCRRLESDGQFAAHSLEQNVTTFQETRLNMFTFRDASEGERSSKKNSENESLMATDHKTLTESLSLPKYESATKSLYSRCTHPKLFQRRKKDSQKSIPMAETSSSFFFRPPLERLLPIGMSDKERLKKSGFASREHASVSQTRSLQDSELSAHMSRDLFEDKGVQAGGETPFDLPVPERLLPIGPPPSKKEWITAPIFKTTFSESLEEPKFLPNPEPLEVAEAIFLENPEPVLTESTGVIESEEFPFEEAKPLIEPLLDTPERRRIQRQSSFAESKEKDDELLDLEITKASIEATTPHNNSLTKSNLMFYSLDLSEAKLDTALPKPETIANFDIFSSCNNIFEKTKELSKESDSAPSEKTDFFRGRSSIVELLQGEKAEIVGLSSDFDASTKHSEKDEEIKCKLPFRQRKQRKPGVVSLESQRSFDHQGTAIRRIRKAESGSSTGSALVSKRSSTSQSSSARCADDFVVERCSECGVILEEYSDEELGLCVVILATFVHREPAMAAPFLPKMLKVVARIASTTSYPWQSESNVHLPGGSVSVARQFLRCMLHQLTPNGIFSQIFQSHSLDAEFFKTMAAALADFTEVNQVTPLIHVFENLNDKKHLHHDIVFHVLENVAIYLDCLPLESQVPPWCAFLQQLDMFLRKFLFVLPASLCQLHSVLHIMLSALKMPVINSAKALLDPFSKILSHAIQHSVLDYQQLTDICRYCYRNVAKERDKLILTRTTVFELVQALKFKSSVPDGNLLILVQFVLDDAGGSLGHNIIVEGFPTNNDGNMYNTASSECMRQYLNDALEFVADVHTLNKVKNMLYGSLTHLNEETLGGQLKAGIAQYLAIEISKGNGRDNRAIGRYLPWLYHPPTTLQQGPKEFIDCVSHIRLLSWLLLGALTHSSLLQNTAAFVCQPIPIEANSHIAEHIQVILAGFAEQSKASVLHMSSLFHAFILCQLWTMYCEHMVTLNPPGSEQNQVCGLTLTDFWAKVTPGILQLVCHSKVLAEMVSLHFLSLMEALMECNSTILARLLPMWTPVLYSFQGQLPGNLHLRLRACISWQPPIQTRDDVTLVSSAFLRWLQRLQFKMGQIELQSSTATQFYSL